MSESLTNKVIIQEKIEEESKEIERPVEIRCHTAWETYKAVQQGYYTDGSGRRHKLKFGKELLLQSQLYPNTTQITTHTRYDKTQIIVVEQDCLYAAQAAIQNGDQSVAVVMFASPLEAGGGMSDGNRGQEEDICRRSDIFGLLWDQAHFVAESILYPLVSLNRADERIPDYDKVILNRMIHTSGVTVFRASQAESYQFLSEPFVVGLLMCPAPNKPLLKGNNYGRKEDEEQMKKVIMTQLAVACEKGYETIILGAFGCGAFQNPPQAVATLYHQIIHQYFDGLFKKIVFAIVEDVHRGPHNPQGNLKPFQDCF